MDLHPKSKHDGAQGPSLGWQSGGASRASKLGLAGRKHSGGSARRPGSSLGRKSHDLLLSPEGLEAGAARPWPQYSLCGLHRLGGHQS